MLRDHLSRPDDIRALLQDLFTQDADLIVDREGKTLTVSVHHFTNPQASRAINAILEELNHSETIYPGTNLMLRYQLVSAPTPAGQDVSSTHKRYLDLDFHLRLFRSRRSAT